MVPPPAPPPPAPDTARPAARGFQIAFRTGVMAPFGAATGEPGDDFARRYAWQIPVVVDIGARFARSFFVGAYVGFGIGATGSDARVDGACNDDDENGQNDIACSAVSARIGIEGLYSFLPDEGLNPWVGYGIGFEVTSASLTDRYRGLEETVSSTGMTYADISVGFDLRKKIGVGPFIDVALGQLNNTTTNLGARGTYKSQIEDGAVHGWVTVGVRFVVNP